MPFLMVRAEVQEAVPAGTMTVSPSAADAIAPLTSAREGLAALIILACIALEAPTNKTARTELRTAELGRNTNGESKSESRWRTGPPVASHCTPDSMRARTSFCNAFCARYNSNFQDLE